MEWLAVLVRAAKGKSPFACTAILRMISCNMIF